MALNIFKCLRAIRPSQICQIKETPQFAVASIFAQKYSTVQTTQDEDFEKMIGSWDTTIKKQKTSRAMRVYLERAKEHDEFMKQQQITFQIGKRHLANMMGEDPLTFTQDDVDRAIEYLFPSGIYDHRARPIMKSPEQLYPARKAAEFDESGRPFHFLFYTGKPNYFKALFDINNQMDELKKYNTTLLIKKAAIDPKSKFDKTGFQFVSKEEFETIIIETVYDVEYRIFLDAIDRLIDLPHSIQKTAFIQKFFKKMIGQKQAFDIPALQYDENGKAFVTTYECLRKDARGHVTVRSPGTGLISINGTDISYFKDNQSREQEYRCQKTMNIHVK